MTPTEFQERAERLFPGVGRRGNPGWRKSFSRAYGLAYTTVCGWAIVGPPDWVEKALNDAEALKLIAEQTLREHQAEDARAA